MDGQPAAENTAIVPCHVGVADPEFRGLVCLENACRLIAEAKDLAEAKLIHDQGETLNYYAKKFGLGATVAIDGAEIKVRAGRQMGDILRAMPGKGQRGGDRKSSCIVRLERLGITKDTSHRWQRIYRDIPEYEFENYITRERTAGREPTTSGLLKLAKRLAQPGKQEGPPRLDACTIEDLKELVNAGRKYGTYYVDPPWGYDNQGTRASTDNHYKTLSVDEIIDLLRDDVRALAADRCFLFLWTTNAFLFECPRIFEAWGFTYQGVYVWCKPQIGIGNCWRVSHEFLVLAIKGEPRVFPKSARNLRSWGEFKRDRHSSKPGQIRTMIEKAGPGPYLELFGRLPFPGWTVWGNEIAKDELLSHGGGHVSGQDEDAGEDGERRGDRLPGVDSLHPG